MTDQFARIKVLSAGILSLILVVGVARFAYTPMLPIMQQQADLGIAEGGWLAAINYIGYLCGAIIASLISDLVLKDKLYRIGLILAVLSTLGMGFTQDFVLWSVLRFIAGLSSAAGMLLGSGLILNWLIRHNHRSELGIHFAGLGTGIALGAIAVELAHQALDWRELWYLLSIIGLIALIPAWAWLPPPNTSTVTTSGQAMNDNPPSKLFMNIFLVMYFCCGVGYVVSATFIVAIVDELPGLQGAGTWTFVLLGLAAAPACILWDLFARRFGDFNALVTAASLNTVGILLPVIEPSLILSLLSAILFGGTFIGLVSLVLTMAGRYYPTRPAKMMGKMTIGYGIAQIIGPAITGSLAEYSGSYSDGLYMASATMVVATLLLLKLKSLDQQTT